MWASSREALSFLDAPLDPKAPVGRLSVANQQLVEICKALVLNSKVIIMDEPTSSLTEHEVRQLFALIRRLKQRGITVLYVSHKIEEIFAICDTVTVLRDGRHIGTVDRQDTSPDQVISMMVGRSLSMLFPERQARRGELIDPVEIEAVINQHPKIEASAVVGVLSGYGVAEEEVKAYIQMRPGGSCSPQDIWDWCSHRMADFKVPRFLEFISELPRTATWKIQKSALKGATKDLTEGCYDRLKDQGK